jgi:hypothetical protein
MSNDPINALEQFYASASPAADASEMLHAIYRASGKRKQQVYGAISGFALGSTLALALLIWASMPSKSTSDKTATAIERYQMINSGLAENTRNRREIPR